MKILLVLALISIVFLACTKEAPVDAEYCEPPRADFCPEVYQPVCAEDGKEYSNGCFACANPKIEWYTAGECSA